jgi:multiple sugar transport system ATP-binding protein
MVFQSYALYPHMTVRQNLSFGLENINTPKAEITAKVDEVAKMLQIDMLLDRRPKDLSGGQRQRVAIGRAVVREPQVFLFDEPLSNLDAELRVDMRGEISALHKRLGNTMVYVTHDQVEAMTMADKIAVLRLGELEQFGRPLDLYNAPENLFVAGFIGSPKMNFLKGIVGEDRTQLTLDTGDHVSLPDTASPSDRARRSPSASAPTTSIPTRAARSTPISAPSSSWDRKATSTAISPTARRSRCTTPARPACSPATA